MENKTNLGTLGKVYEIMKRNGIVDIPDSADAQTVALAIVVELPTEDLTELLETLGSNKLLSDEEALKLLESFFTNMGENLKRFLQMLGREFQQQRNMAIQKMEAQMDKIISEITTGIDIDSLQAKVSAVLSEI